MTDRSFMPLSLPTAMKRTGSPSRGSTFASIPCSVPTNRTSLPPSLSSSRAMAIPGYKCPPVPPPAIMTFMPGPWTLDSGPSWRRFPRYIQQHSQRRQRDHQRRPAVAHERERDALGWQEPGHDRHIDHPLKTDQERDTERKQAAERIARGACDAHPPPQDHEKQREHKERADQTQFLTDHRIDEVRDRK